MKKVLIHEGDVGVDVWDVSTPELKEKAFKSLFRILDGEDYRVYEDLELPTHIRWYDEAKKGSYECLIALLEDRKSYEYEEWYITRVRE